VIEIKRIRVFSVTGVMVSRCTYFSKGNVISKYAKHSMLKFTISSIIALALQFSSLASSYIQEIAAYQVEEALFVNEMAVLDGVKSFQGGWQLVQAPHCVRDSLIACNVYAYSIPT
jgi:hypothetical protein